MTSRSPTVVHENLSPHLGIREGHVAVIIGAGGKHTLMHRLSQELAAAGLRVVITSTTNLHRSPDYARLPTLLTGDCADWKNNLATRLNDEQRLVVVDSTTGPNMYKGIRPEMVAQISAAAPHAVLLVKADGARKRFLKAPGDDEPVYPQHVDLCVLTLSLAAIGKPLNDRYVHRLDRVMSMTTGPTVIPQTLVDVILEPGGYAQCLPTQGRNVLYLSSCNTAEALTAARTIWERTRRGFHASFSGDTINGSFFAPKDV